MHFVWYVWPIVLFFFTFVIGILAPISGVGGGVLFVPLATALFPINLDFIRGTGLIMALLSALSSAPQFLKEGLANIKVMAPIVIVSMIASVAGGIVGLWITNNLPSGKDYVEIALGVVLFMIFAVYLFSKRLENPPERKPDFISRALNINGQFYDRYLDETVQYRTSRMPIAIPAFVLIGLLAGMFGMGAGWANVPLLNLVLGVPIKVATSTSMLVISVNDASASFVYLANGALLPLIIVPCVLGTTIGARIGTKIATRIKPQHVKYLVMAIMLVAAVVDIQKGVSGLKIF